MNLTNLVRLRDWPMWGQVFLTWLVISILTVVVISLWVERFELTEFKRSLRDQSEAKLELLETALLDAVIAEDIPVLEGVVTKLAQKDSDLAAIWIKNEQDTILVEQAKEDLPTRDDALYLKTSFVLEGERFGCIEVLWDLRRFHQRVTENIYDLGILIAACLSCSAVIFFLLLNGLILRPLNKMGKRLKRISRGELQGHLSLHTSSEIGNLSDSINMLSEVLIEQSATSNQLKLAESDLREAQDRLLEAIDAVPAAFVLYDSKDRLVICNERYRTMYSASSTLIEPGAKFEDILREGLRLGQYSDAIGREEEWLIERMESHLNPQGQILQCLEDGRWVRIEERRTKDGGIVGFRSDITELKCQEFDLRAAKEKAESANQAKAGFLAMMSHEIRTPLNGVLGILGLLRETQLDDRQKAYIHTARESGDALLTVINDVLDFSKMEAGKLDFESAVIDPKQLLDSAYQLFKPRARSKNLHIEVLFKGELPKAFIGDPGRIRQILLNLVSNSVKFTETGGVCLILESRLQESGRFLLHFEVTDTGIGIDNDKQQELFEEFSTLDASFSRKFGGTGLGLSICKRLVEMMGGTIGVESAPGIGSHFWFELSVGEGQLPLRETKIMDFQGNRVGQLKAARILVVEDVLANWIVAKGLLEAAGHQVDFASNGIEAVEAVRTYPYDLVLMDISMPEMDGMEATGAIRQLEKVGENIPIVAMTAHAMEGDRDNFLRAGMDDYLTKPINRDDLLHIVTQWTGCLGVVSDDDSNAAPNDRSFYSMKTSDELKDTAARSGAEVNNKPVSLDLPTLSHTGLSDESFDAGYNGSPTDHNVATKGSLFEGFVDEAVLLQMAEDTDPVLLPELLEVFIEDSSSRLNRIQLAVERKDCQGLNHESHALGSSSGTYGLPELHNLAREVETSSLNKALLDWTSAERLVDMGGKAVASMARYLDIYKRRLKNK